MNLRHAAALAVVGWYLMYPPMTSPNQVPTDWPLAEWKNVGSFDTATDCEGVKIQMADMIRDPTEIAKMKEDALKEGGHWDQQVAITRSEAAKCVSTDDPRLGK